MTASPFPESLHGKTIRWTFKDGPTRGHTFEHRFSPDGYLTWRGTGPGSKDHHESASASATVKVSDDVHLVSYLSGESGYTLTVALNFRTGTVIGFASSAKDWVQQSGTFEVLGASR